jgi:hypothetical protein
VVDTTATKDHSGPLREKQSYAQCDPCCAFHAYQFPSRAGILKRGDFPVAVVRKYYEDRGYQCCVSAQSKHGIPCYLLERMPGRRRAGDPAYRKTIELFGQRTIQRLHRRAAQARAAWQLRVPVPTPTCWSSVVRSLHAAFSLK